jgi:hypothetical protein
VFAGQKIVDPALIDHLLDGESKAPGDHRMAADLGARDEAGADHLVELSAIYPEVLR